MVCENCGRILVDTDLFDAVEAVRSLDIIFKARSINGLFLCIKSSGDCGLMSVAPCFYTNLPAMMIDKLQIRNYAIIDELDISLPQASTSSLAKLAPAKVFLMGSLPLNLGAWPAGRYAGVV